MKCWLMQMDFWNGLNLYLACKRNLLKWQKEKGGTYEKTYDLDVVKKVVMFNIDEKRREKYE